MLYDTKTFIGRKVIKRKLKHLKRVTKVCNINDARNIGIIFNATNMASFEIIKNFIKSLSGKKVKVNALGYVHSKKLIDHYLYRKGFDFFTKGNLNWFNKPVKDTVENFIKKPFDILINLYLEEYYPIQYIVALSASTFKVGKYYDEPNYLDFMIDIEKEKQVMHDLRKEVNIDKKPDDKNIDLEKDIDKKVEIELQLNFLLNQLIYYLSIIKSN